MEYRTTATFVISLMLVACADDGAASAELGSASTSTGAGRLDTGAGTSGVDTAATTTATDVVSTSGGAPSSASTSSSSGSSADTSAGTTAADGGTTEVIPDVAPMLPPPPPVLLSAPAAAAGGWVYLVLGVPLGAVTVTLDGVDLGEPDSKIPLPNPVALWRVPADAAVGTATLAVHWAFAPASATEIAVEIAAPRFVDVADSTGLTQVHDASGTPAECAKSHTGVAFGDFDGDERVDAYVGNVGSAGRLFHNLGDVDDDGEPDFEEVTNQVGLDDVDSVAMATFVDLDGDGDRDLFIGRRGTNRMFDNQLIETGVATFVDITAELGLDGEDQRTMGAAFGDYDGDGDLDLYTVNHAWCFPIDGSVILAEDHLYRNDGDTFVERTADLSPTAGSSVGFSAVWVDIERDGDPDLIVVNDDVGGNIGDPNEVWRNDGPGDAGEWLFTDVSSTSGIALPGVNGMGLALGDVDGDGFVDVAISNIGDNVLLLNDGSGVFSDIADKASTKRGAFPWGNDSITWATHLWDHDNDGDLDLYYAGGSISAKGPVSDAFLVGAGDGTFVDLTWESGLADPASGKASALVDLDRDGAWDLATAAWAAPLRLWHNRGAPANNHWLDVDLVGLGPNRDALGAIVEIVADDVTQVCFHAQKPSLGAGGELTCHFGLGGAVELTALAVIWPDGTVDDRPPPPIDQRVVLVQGE